MKTVYAVFFRHQDFAGDNLDSVHATRESAKARVDSILEWVEADRDTWIEELTLHT